MKRCCLALLWIAVCGLSPALNQKAGAQERRAIAEIDMDALTGDMQISAPGGSEHMNMIWAIPIEFWKVAFAADPSMTPAQRAKFIGALEEYVVIGIVQADIGVAGDFDFYSEGEVRKELKVSFTDTEEKTRPITPTDQVGKDAQELLAGLKPLLSAAMGDMGQNLHFIVVNDDAGEAGRTWDPYAVGMLNIDLATRDGEALNGKMEGPINALFVPRKCPNGKDAHVTWKFCPWTGEALK